MSGYANAPGFLKKSAINTWELVDYENELITFYGDISGNGKTNINVTLSNSGVVSGIYNTSATAVTPFTVDSKGRVTAVGNNVTITPSWSSILNKPDTLGGFGIIDAASKVHIHEIADISNLQNLVVYDANKCFTFEGTTDSHQGIYFKTESNLNKWYIHRTTATNDLQFVSYDEDGVGFKVPLRLCRTGSVFLNETVVVASTVDDGSGSKLQLNGSLNVRNDVIRIDNVQVLKSRISGWDLSTIDPDVMTHTELATLFKQLITDLTFHGLIGL